MKPTDLSQLREEMRAVARGDRTAPPRPAAPLLAALSPEAMDLLTVVIGRHPGTITELAQMTGRAQPNVSRSLQQLERHGLLRLVKEGREVRPEARVLKLHVDLATGTYEAETAAG